MTSFETIGAPDEGEEIVELEKLQTAGEIGGEKWGPDKAVRLEELRALKNGAATQEQIDEFNRLSREQTNGGINWAEENPESSRRLTELYPLIERGRSGKK